MLDVKNKILDNSEADLDYGTDQGSATFAVTSSVQGTCNTGQTGLVKVEKNKQF